MKSQAMLWVNGKHDQEQKPWLEDLSWLQAYHCFDTMRSYLVYDAQGKQRACLFWQAEHLDRLLNGAQRMGFTHQKQSLIQDIEALYPSLKGNEVVRIILNPSFRLMIVTPAPIQRFTPKSAMFYCELPKRGDQIPADIKHGQRGDWLFAKQLAQVDELILCDAQGYLKEGDSSALLLVINDMLYFLPEDQNCLASITRKALIQLLSLTHIPYYIAPIHQSQRIDAICLLGSIKELSPVYLLKHQPLESTLHPLLKRVILLWENETKKLDFCLSSFKI